MKKPVVHYKGNPSFSSGFAFLVAIDHPRFPANFPVRTSHEFTERRFSGVRWNDVLAVACVYTKTS